MALHLRQNLDMRLEQKLKLTPQMIQSIEILLLPQLALEERIMQEVESNPALEIMDGGDGDEASGDEAAERSDDGADHDDGGDEPPTSERGDGETLIHDSSPWESERQADLDHERYSDWLKSHRQAQSVAGDEDAPDRMEAIEATAGPAPTLAEHLLEQLRFEDMDDITRQIITDIAWQLDRRGYLTVPLTDLCADEHLEQAERAWELLRHCDPAGVGARDLADCLMLQLQRESGDNSFEMRLVREQLDNLLRNRLPAIAAALAVDVVRVQEGLEVIAGLDPAPGAPFSRSDNQIVIPDVIAERDERGEWIVSIPDSQLPKIQVSESYHQLYEDGELNPRDKAYLKEQLGAARFIIDAIQQRKRTLLKIATEIVKHQKAFLEYGPEHLRPLMRQDIADRIGMHVATVSRAVKDKYIQTPGGTLPLSAFFSGGIATQDGGEAESSKVVKMKIKALIEKEDGQDPLSDQAIADLLAKEGLDISRRTVTKYRIAENIGSTRQRRRFDG